MSARRGILAGPVLPAIVCLALGGALFQLLGRPADRAVLPASTSAGGESLVAPAVLDPFTLRPIEAFSEIVDRPVFSPTRRPPAGEDSGPEVVDTTTAQRQALDVTVVGIITGPRKLALLRSASGDRLLPLAEGDDLYGWTLTGIEPFRLVFRREDDEQMVEIEYRDD